MANWGAGNYMITMAAARKRAEESARMRKHEEKMAEDAAWRNLGLGLLGAAGGSLIKAGSEAISPDSRKKRELQDAQAKHYTALTGDLRGPNPNPTPAPTPAGDMSGVQERVESMRPSPPPVIAPATPQPTLPPTTVGPRTLSPQEVALEKARRDAWLPY